jgi:hypothetical protein
MTDATSSLVIFQPRAGDREIAMLGVVEVGEIGPCLAGGLFYWRLWLPGCRQLGRAGIPKSARDQLTVKIEQWVEAAGLAPMRKDEIRAFRSDDWDKIKQAVRP